MNYSDYVLINTSASPQTLTILCDTQADISIIKESSVQNNLDIDTTDIIRIRGVTNDIIRSIGTVNLKIYFNENVIEQIFHVVPDDFNIPADGILGKDFNRNFRCKIDYDDMSLTIRTNELNIVVPIQSEPKENKVALPAWCRTFRIFSIKNFSGTCLIPAQEIAPGVFVPNAIAHSEKIRVPVLNTNEHMTVVENQLENGTDINNYEIYTMSNEKGSGNCEKRLKKLKEYFKKKTPKQFLGKILNLCSRYTDVFALPEDKMTVNNFYKQKLRLKNETAVYAKNYRLPKTQKDEIDKQVKKLLDNELIEPSVSSFNSPLIVVPKKSSNGEKKWRMCVDYRMLNKNLIPDKFPLPRIDDILDSLGRAKYFSCLDLFSGFHQIPIEEESREMTAFSTDKGAYQWKVLPFGLNVAPNSFARMMSLAFAALPPEQAFIYMDDIVVIGCSEDHQLENLEAVFKICRKYNLRLNPEKCEFFRPEVTFLGHSCTEKGILPDNKKLDSIDRYPKPHDKEATKRFTAFANYYRRFIPNFSQTIQPLNSLSRKRVEFMWTDECEHAFEAIKWALKSPKLLAYPDFKKEFIVTVDASNMGVGSQLSQMFDGVERPIAFASKSFKNGELNKPIIEKELLAIHFAITTFRPYLYGTHFTVLSDHAPLVYLYNMKNPASKLTRIRLELEEYDFTIIHIKGKDNVVADALSRIKLSDIKSSFEESETVLVMTRAQTRNLNKNDKMPIKINENDICKEPKIYEKGENEFDKSTPRIKSKLEKDKYVIRAYQKHKELFAIKITGATGSKIYIGKILRTIQNETVKSNIGTIQWPMNDPIFEVVSINEFKNVGNTLLENLTIHLVSPSMQIKDKNEKSEIFAKYHNDPLYGGHVGIKKMYSRIRSKYYWKDMVNEIRNYVMNCERCNVSKHRNHTKVPMMITNTPQKPFDVVIIDTIGPLPKSENGNVYAVTIICDMTKYLVTCAVPDKTAKSIAKAIFENFILIYSPMKEIRTDHGTEYINETISELCKLSRVEHKYSTSYRHETVGSIERNHAFFNQYIRSYIETISEWETYLKYFTFLYNTSTHASFNDKFTPFELVFSRKANMPFDLSNKIDPWYNIEDYVKESKFRLQSSHLVAQKLLNKIKMTNKTYYDKNAKELNLEVGDKVYIENKPYNKFKPVYSGPFEIKSIDEPNVTIFDEKTNKTQLIHKNRIRT